jgi:hypothetical protein
MSLETFPPALWLIPLALLAIVGLIFLLARRWQSAAEGDLKALRSALRQFHSGRRQIEAAAGAYSENDPEPYRSQAAGLRRLLTAISRRAELLERRYIDLHQQALDLKGSRWRALFGAPHAWYTLRKEIARLQADLTQAYTLLEQAAGLEKSLENLSWEVALQVRQLQQELNSLSQVLAELRARNMYGDTFEAALQQEKEFQVALSQVPRPYLEADQAELLQGDSKESTARAYEIMELHRAPLAALLENGRLWQTQLQTAQGNVGVMRRALDELEAALKDLPPRLDAAEEGSQRRQLEVIAQNLQEALSRLEVESLPLVAAEAERVAQNAQETSQRLAQARLELVELDRSLSELMEGFRQLSLLLATFGAKSTHPVKWETSLEQLTQLNRGANSLINTRQPRTPAVGGADLASLAQIAAEGKALVRRCEAIGLAHTDLLALLESPELSQLPKWIQTARQPAGQASQYAPENWPRSDSLASLPAEIEDLAQSAQRLVSGDRSEPISELEIDERLEETRQLASDYRKLAARLETVRSRLEQLQRAEEMAQERLEDLGKTLNQIQLIVNSNPFLSNLASQEIDQLTSAIQKNRADLADRQRGSVEKKLRQSADLAARAESSANRWLEQLAKENRELVRELAGVLSELDAIAPLEDPAVAEVRRLLSSEGRHANEANEALEGRSRLALSETILELKSRSAFWQECRAAQQKLESLRQLIESYREASFQRDKSHQLLGPASARQRTKRAWPPSSFSPQAELQELEAIDQQWGSLKAHGGRAISLVAQFGGLSNRYQALAEKARQNAERAAQEGAQIEQLEAAIAERAELWQSLLDQHRDNPLASQELHELLDSIDQEQDRIRRGYLQGDLDYAQVLQALKALERKVRFYQVALDDEHALDASGRVTRRRHSEREQE